MGIRDCPRNCMGYETFIPLGVTGKGRQRSDARVRIFYSDFCTEDAMKRLLILLLLLSLFKLFAFEIVVIGVKDTNTSAIRSYDLYSSIATINGLTMRNYSLGSGVFPSYPGLSSVNTSIVFQGITLNSLKLGTFDLANFPGFLINNVSYYNEDISYINGINGIGGGININYFMKKKISSRLFIDNYYSDFQLIVPIKLNKILFNFMYENRNGNSKRINSNFKRNYYGFSMKPLEYLKLIYTYSTENLGVPGPMPPQDNTSYLFNGTDATYTKNYQMGKYENLFLTYNNKSLLLSMNYEKNTINYHYFSMWGNGIANNIDENLKFFAKFNIIDNEKLKINSGINYMKQFDNDNIDFSRENILFQSYMKKIGIGGNIQIYGSNFNKVGIGGNIYFENYIFGIKTLAMLSKGVRFPTYNEMYYPFGGNANLKDENSYNISLKISKRIFELTYEHKYVHNMILWIPYDYFYYRTENIGQKQINKLGIKVNYKGELFSVKNDLALYFGKEKNSLMDIHGNPFTKIQKASYLPNIIDSFSMSINMHKMMFILSLNYRGKMINNYIDKELSPLLTMDITLGNKLFSAGIKNILNSKGAVNFGYSKEDLDYPNVGRELFMIMRF